MPLSRRVIATALFGLPVLAARPASAGEQPVRVYSTTDQPLAQALIDDFERRHPGLRVEYVELGSRALYERFLAEGGRMADVLWSSAMDLQIKLVNDGHAASHESPHARQLPRWAVWKHEAYGTTCEPVGIVYHRHLLAPAELPRTHAALAALLRSDTPRFRGRVATYDIERAGLGFLIAAHDAMASPLSWELVRALGACRAGLHADTLGMLEGVAAGRLLLAYNVLGSYAEAFAKRFPDLGVIYPSDYTLVTSRVAFVARQAPNPRGARLWLDHLLSPEGQRLLAEGGGLHAVRTDAAPPRSALSLARQLGASAWPIALGPGLLACLDRSKRNALLKRWRREFDSSR
ncbi:MAG TPA: extracellular solute-binding protein [Ideonella sp.]|nr:extracellular solute-binding protein [Ideonella sp.]